MVKIFLSYSRADAEAANWLADTLRKAGYSVWYDADIPAGTSIPREVFQRIDAADCMIILWSAAASRSEWVQHEMDAAITRTKERTGFAVVPARLDGSPLPRPLANLLAVDMAADRQTAAREITRALAALAPASTGPDGGPGSDTRRSGETNAPVPEIMPAAHEPGTDIALPYKNLFRLASLELPYVELISRWEPRLGGYRIDDVDIAVDDAVYDLPALFPEIPVDVGFGDDPKCRLVSYRHRITARDLPNRLILRFSRILYSDYLRSGEHLDDLIPDGSGRTFREVYAPEISRQHDLSDSHLPNIVGVGLFLITRDDKVIIAKHSSDVLVYSDVLSYSASGTMDWGDNPNPFLEAARECAEEIGHRVNLENLRLFAVGVDATKLYYQFSFLERTARSSHDVISAAASAPDYDAEIFELIAIPLQVEPIVERIIGGERWEPAAAATLLTLCAQFSSREALERAIDQEFVDHRWRDLMKAKWQERAERQGELAVMSTRYAGHRLDEESEKYLDAVEDFLGRDVDRKDVLEIGCGIGRLTDRLVRRAGRLTALDLSEEMIRRNQERLGRRASSVDYVCSFAQDYRPEARHDVVLCSLVLIHNVEEKSFQELVSLMTQWADTIFLFEDVSPVNRGFPDTQLRSEQELLDAFAAYRVERRQIYPLFDDLVLFAKLVRA